MLSPSVSVRGKPASVKLLVFLGNGLRQKEKKKKAFASQARNKWRMLVVCQNGMIEACYNQ